MTSFQPTILSDWATASKGIPARLPEVIGPMTPEQTGAYQVANLTMAPLKLPEFERFRAVLHDTLQFNTHRPLGGRRLVVVNGPSHIGKSTAILAEGRRQVAEAGIVQHPNGRIHPIPWVYVEATAGGRGRVLARSIADFLGLPVAGRDTAYDIVNRVASLSREIGIEVIVIDDFHFMQARHNAERGELANILKHLISSVPATFVIAGVGVHLHPLMKNAQDTHLPSDQILNRSNWVQFTPWPSGSEHDDDQWIQLIGALRRLLNFPRGIKQWRLDQHRSLSFIQEGSGRRPATAIEWLILAANAAIADDTPLTIKSLRATSTQWRRTG